MSLNVIKDAETGNPKTIKATAIIAPKLREVADIPGDTVISVDLGTSNTYIAYTHNGIDYGVHEISTVHDDYNELILMNTECTKKNRADALDANRSDLYLRTSDGGEPKDTCLPAQLCEFMPTRIIDSKDTSSGFRFPIPSVINNLRINCSNDGTVDKKLPLIHNSIPFAYYTIGKRINSEYNVYDTISRESFKWFYKRNKLGIFKEDATLHSDFKSFLEELLFIVRCHMLCKGYDLNKCKLIWTYPLSFETGLVKQYKHDWNYAFCKYFHSQWLNADGSDVAETFRMQLSQYILVTNESRSPIYECVDNPAAVNRLTILMDIGGGSTDIIGYKNMRPQFITSFGFAGNAVYMDGSMNSDPKYFKKNIFSWYLHNHASGFLKRSSVLKGTKQIDGNDESINALMNYGFSEYRNVFESMFQDNPHPQFLLQLHNAALMFHTAQLCHAKNPDEMPFVIYLTGNGSKLVQLNNKKDSMICKIFESVYNAEAHHFQVQSPDNPKAATANGSLKGIENDLVFNDNAADDRIVLLGDEMTYFELDPQDGSAQIPYDKVELFKTNVEENVKKFIDVFYSAVYTTNNPIISKEQLIDCFELIKNDEKLNFGADISDSMFFRYIALMMEQVSYKFCSQLGI